MLGHPIGDKPSYTDQWTNKLFIRIFSRVHDRADSLVGTIAETIGPQVSEALTLVTHPESRLAVSSLQIYWSQKPDKRFVKILKSVGKLLIYWFPGTDSNRRPTD